jgi:hypothetical protein
MTDSAPICRAIPPIKRWEFIGMKMMLCAGAFALAMIALWSNIPAASASELSDASFEQSGLSIDIGRIRSVLQLTPAQETYWPPVETALRGIARQQARAEPDGVMARIGRRAVFIVLNGAAIERLAVAARPLIAVLTDDQKRAASGLAQEMGLGAVVLAALK